MNEQTKTPERAVAGFGLAAAITVVFNVVLALVKDAYEPLNTLMAHMTGHHWITHGLADVILFILLGWLFTARGIPASGLTNGLVVTVGLSVVVAGSLLGLWFVFF